MRIVTAKQIQQQLRILASPAVARSSARFFKTAPGEYGAGDLFIGVRIPPLRTLAREHRSLAFSEIEVLLQSPIHEERMLALLILTLTVTNAAQGKTVYDFYVRNIANVNNWDLVDGSAPAIVGGYLLDRSRQPLEDWARSANLWERRIAMIATLHFIRRDDFKDTLKIALVLRDDPEDLIHKASGWMLREVGKRHLSTLNAFLQAHGTTLPRTALRYAIERHPPATRKAILRGDFSLT